MPGTHRLLSRCTLYPIFQSFYQFNASSLSIYPSIASIFPVFCHGTSVCLTRTQMHLPQAQPLHRINVFARFFHGFLSVLLLHSGHTSKPQFFHCFSIVSRVLYAIMVPHRSLKCSIVVPSYRCPSFHSYFILFYLASFSSDIRAAIFPLCFHCFTPLLHHCFSIPTVMVSHRSHICSIAFR